MQASESLDDKLPSLGEDVDREEREIEEIHDDSPVDKTHPELEKVQSSSKRSEIDPFAEPPDGGLNAWLKVLGCFLLYSNIWGFTLTFGAFQTYYQHSFLSTTSPSAISWIGTVQSFLLILVGVLSGPLFDLGWYRPMLFLGNFAIAIGIFMLSLSKTYWQVFLSQAVCMGLGAGLLYVPSLALIGLAFSRKRALAQGIVTSGIAVGGIAYIIAFDQLSSTRGFGWAVRTMGFISLGICVIAFPALLSGTKSLAKARTARKLFDMDALKDGPFLVFTASTFFTFFGYIVPYFFIPAFAQDVLGISQKFALYILIISIAASFFGRLSAGVIAHRLGSIFTWFWCAAVSGILSVSWAAVSSQNGLIVFSVFWGFCSAGLVTLPASVFPSLCPDRSRLGTRIGMSWGLSSIASLTGSPIAGALLKKNHGGSRLAPRSDYLGPQLWAGCCLLIGAGMIGGLWVMTARKRKNGIFI